MTVIAPTLGVLLTKWTIRLALLCYVSYLAGWLAIRSPQWPNRARTIWTLGCVLFVVHVALAFHFYYQWSHALAWQSTADGTQELLGVAFGDGIYVSYLFLVLWVLDVGWLWLRSFGNEVANGTPRTAATLNATAVPIEPNKLVETPWWRLLVHIFLLFVAFNGAIVFEAGPTRWLGITASLALLLLAARYGFRRLQYRDTKCPTASARPSAPFEESTATT
jgi:hypothetical protein